MTSEPTNHDRAGWAREALVAFTATTYGGDHPDTMHLGDLESAIHDLIADLLHYARQRGFEPGDVITRACYHFECELREEVAS